MVVVINLTGFVCTSGYAQEEPLHPRRICWTGERIFVTDEGDTSVKEIDFRGKVLKTFGRKGKGPGEYQSMDGLTCGSEGLYVLDGILKRITYIPYKEPRGVQTHPFDDHLGILHTLVEWGDRIIITGDSKRNIKTVHVYDRSFTYLTSIGPGHNYRDSGNYPDILYARHQLSETGLAVLAENSLYYGRSAPFEFGIIEMEDLQDEMIFYEKRHDLVPPPWETKYMYVTRDEYRVGLYARQYAAYGIPELNVVCLFFLFNEGKPVVNIYLLDLETRKLDQKLAWPQDYDLIVSNPILKNGKIALLHYDFPKGTLLIKEID